MSKAVQSVRGMNDLVPAVMPYWHYIERTLRQLTQRFGFQEIRFPILESTALFKRSIGDVTDIVEKEMFTFVDREGDSLSLRPEGTAGCVRAGIEQGLFYNQHQKLWYLGPMFRHERPQRGRYRQFHQFGLEAFGYANEAVDAELLLFAQLFWREIGLLEHVSLELNTVGLPEDRKRYGQSLITYFSRYEQDLDEESKRRLHANPLRILDSKNPALAQLIDNAPKLMDVLSDEAKSFFDRLCELLVVMNIEFHHNPRIVRGLDYYTHTVFEWVTKDLGAQGTVCGGGRYDGLVSMLGHRQPVPAVGFAMGIERIVELLQIKQPDSQMAKTPDAYLVLLNDEAITVGMSLTARVRSTLPNCQLVCHLQGGKIKNQFKSADKSGAVIALIIGEEELNNQTVTVKWLREEGRQQTCTHDEVLELLKGI